MILEPVTLSRLSDRYMIKGIFRTMPFLGDLRLGVFFHYLTKWNSFENDSILSISLLSTINYVSENLRDAFKVNKTEYTGKKLLLLDDISTTGTTLDELKKSFEKEGISVYYALVAANPVSETKYQ
jgi:hypothetical protein